MTELEKRFDLSPEGVRLNVSAGLPVPEGRLEQDKKKIVLKPTRPYCPITSSNVQLLPADGKWRFAVRPIHIAVCNPRPLEAG
jgi:hypothetical protein